MEMNTGTGIIIGTIGSLLGSLLILGIGAAVRFIRRLWRLRRLRRFWGKPSGPHKNAYLFYPSYPNPRVGRTQKGTGYYLSNEDATAVEFLERSLTEMGFKCQRKLSDTGGDMDQPFPKEGTIILVCGPKLDTAQNCVGYDAFVGGNPVSSWFYLRYHESMELKLTYNQKEARKEYHLPNKKMICSGQDEDPAKDIDRGLLIRTKIRDQRFVLCWGIHGSATLATVQAGFDQSCLRELTGSPDDLIATIDAIIDKAVDKTKPNVTGVLPLPLRKEGVSGIKPNPFSVGNYLEKEKPVYGLSYLWATPDNIDCVISGNYQQLTPIAAELDPSLHCNFNCGWCAYDNSKSNLVLGEKSKALPIVEKLAEIGIKLVVLTGGGEPLMSPLVEEISEQLRSKNILVVLYTNGYHLNDLRAYHLLSRRISEIRISLDDISSGNNYGAVHGLGSEGEKAMEIVRMNTRNLLGLRAKNGFATRIGVSFLVSDSNLPNLTSSAKQLAEWTEGVGPFDYVLIRPAVKYWPTTDPLDSYFQSYSTSNDVLEKAIAFFREEAAARHVIASWQRFDDIKIARNQTYNKCLAPSLWLNIGPDGTAYLCCETKHKPDWQLGNILNDDLTSLLNVCARKARRDPTGIGECPKRLCKPSTLNLLFAGIEKGRRNGQLPNDTVKWLKEMSKHARTAGISDAFIPSVSGIYVEYSPLR